MSRMMDSVISRINSALFFQSGDTYQPPVLRPWQYVQMEYERVGLVPPAEIPHFDTIEDAQIWMCLDSRYNRCLMREQAARATWPQAV